MGLLLERKLCGVRGQGLCVKDMPALRQVSIFRSLKPFPCLPISMYASVSKDTKTRFLIQFSEPEELLSMLWQQLVRNTPGFCNDLMIENT